MKASIRKLTNYAKLAKVPTPLPLALRQGINRVLFFLHFVYFFLYLLQAGREMSEFTRVPHNDPQDHITCSNNAKNGISTNHDTNNMPPPPAYDVAMTNKYGFKDS